jgi:hypothetical protein
MTKYILSSLVLFTSLFAIGQSTIKINTDINSDNLLVLHCTLDDFGSIFKLSQMTGVPVENILADNKFKNTSDIQKDDDIKVVMSPSKVSPSPNLDGKTYVLELRHKVKSGETLFRIAKTVLGRSVLEFSKSNRINESSIKPGQDIVMGYINVQGNEIIIAEVEPKDTQEIKEIKTGPEVVYVKEKGIAYVHSSQSEGKFVLHPFAKLNSEIQIYSPFLRRSVRAKVIGRIPQGAYMSDTDIVLSSSTARSLGALDGRFKVEMIYEDPSYVLK